MEQFELELKALEDHITHSDDAGVYLKVTDLLENPKNHYIYDRKSKDYQRLDLLSQHLDVIEETGLYAPCSGEETPGKLRQIGRTNSKTIVQFF